MRSASGSLQLSACRTRRQRERRSGSEPQREVEAEKKKRYRASPRSLAGMRDERAVAPEHGLRSETIMVPVFLVSAFVVSPGKREPPERQE